MGQQLGPTRTATLANRLTEAAAVALGTAAGSALGILARLWMRLISDNPEFTWSGTIFIVLGFTIFGLAQSVAALARRRLWRPWAARAARGAGFVGMLPLFVAAGGQMMPTVVFGALATWRIDWPRAARVVCVLIAALPVVLVSQRVVHDFGWTTHSSAGIASMVAIYVCIVWATHATVTRPVSGWRVRTVGIVAAVGAAVFFVAQAGIRAA